MYKLEDINFKTVNDPKGFCEESDNEYKKKVTKTTDKIIANIKNSPIVLLSGPSGSGKTTTAMKICDELNRRGIGTYYVSMDDYFKSVSPETTPVTETGEYDLESPLCLDMDLLNKHFDKLKDGEKVLIPRFDFRKQRRSTTPSKSIQLKKDEVCIFEGIHALNDEITNKHPDAFKLYISARSDVEFNGDKVFKRTWFRLVRRMVRDYNFRGTSSEKTMTMWANVRRGETQYISPYKDKADYQFDSSLECELPILRMTASKLFSEIPQGIERFEELKKVYPALQLFGDIDEQYVAEDSLIREFIGGGIYDY